MGFSVENLRELLRIIEEHPEWKRELRRAILSDELLELPLLVRDLAEAQRRTEEEIRRLAEAQRRTEERLEALGHRMDELARRVDELAEAQRRTEERLNQLAEAQRRTEERLEALARRVDELAQRVDALARRMDELAEAQRRTEERLSALAARVDQLAQVVERLVVDVADLKGDHLERKFREKLRQFVRRPYRHARLVPQEVLGDELDNAVDAGILTEEEAAELLRADAVVSARDAEGDMMLVVEVSWVVDRNDVERAMRRAAILRKLGKRVRAAVAGARFTEGADREAVSGNVIRLTMQA